MHETTQPRRYRIVVHGWLGEHLASAFEDLDLEAHRGETWLTGTFVDQAQLIGLLDWLRDLGISIVSVNPSTDAVDASHQTHPDREFQP
jgi:hypothetical protein